MRLLRIYLITINAIAFLLMGLDKRKARKHLWRIPEAVLMGAALLGGSPGGILGMLAFHHKTRKPKFYLGFPLIFLLETGALLWFFSHFIF